MVRVQIEGKLGIDLAQVLWWKLYSNPNKGSEHEFHLAILFVGGGEISISRKSREVGFDRLYRLLLDAFPVDLCPTGEAE